MAVSNLSSHPVTPLPARSRAMHLPVLLLSPQQFLSGSWQLHFCLWLEAHLGKLVQSEPRGGFFTRKKQSPNRLLEQLQGVQRFSYYRGAEGRV